LRRKWEEERQESTDQYTVCYTTTGTVICTTIVKTDLANKISWVGSNFGMVMKNKLGQYCRNR